MKICTVHRYYDDSGKYVKSKRIVSLRGGVRDTMKKEEKQIGKTL
jgi:hypothetical protein